MLHYEHRIQLDSNHQNFKLELGNPGNALTLNARGGAGGNGGSGGAYFVRFFSENEKFKFCDRSGWFWW